MKIQKMNLSRIGWPSVVATVTLFYVVVVNSYEPPRMPDGTPSFQGVTWDNGNKTPLERMQGFDSLVIAREQATVIENIILGLFTQPGVPNDSDFSPIQLLPIDGNYRSSLIVDPPDGRIPGNTLFINRAALVLPNLMTAMDGPEQRPLPERCIGGVGSLPPYVSSPAYNYYQFLQTPTAIVVWSAIMPQARVIRVGEGHNSVSVQSLMGDSVGKWEGDTLVVETINFSETGAERTAPFVAFFVSPATKLIERFTRISSDELAYQFTLSDPRYYTKPWTAEVHFVRVDEPMYEYSCHEGNYSLTNILKGGRTIEKR